MFGAVPFSYAFAAATLERWALTATYVISEPEERSRGSFDRVTGIVTYPALAVICSGSCAVSTRQSSRTAAATSAAAVTDDELLAKIPRSVTGIEVGQSVTIDSLTGGAELTIRESWPNRRRCCNVSS